MSGTIVQVFTKQVYGQPMVYPANREARLFAQLIGAKTFNDSQLRLIKDLGCQIERVFEPETKLQGAYR